jgi:hypothetical protein
MTKSRALCITLTLNDGCAKSCESGINLAFLVLCDRIVVSTEFWFIWIVHDLNCTAN